MSIDSPQNNNNELPVGTQVNEKPQEIASRGLRFGAYLLDLVFLCLTLIIGWLIWTLIVWGRGQTPAKQVLKMRVMNSKNNRPAEWGQMAIRNFVIPAVYFISYFTLLVVSGAFDLIVSNGFSLISSLIQLVYVIISIVDKLWIFRPEKQRLTDVIARTYVIKEA